MQVLRTPDRRFEALPDFPFAPRYLEVPSGEGERLRVHLVDQGPHGAPPVLCLHGEPSWSFLYRKMLPTLVAAGYRVVAPDLVGFGRSDKPVDRRDHTYQRHVDWMREVLLCLDLRDVTLLCQDWGGLIGLRLVGEHPERFARVAAANTFLPTGDASPGEAFLRWQRFSQEVESFPVSGVLQWGSRTELPPEVLAAYDAPFPEERFKEGPRQMPALVPTRPDDPAAEPNRRAWKGLEAFERPFLTAFADGDPITRGADAALRERIPGAKGQPHTTIEGAGHFLQEDRGEALARVLVDWMGEAGGAAR